MPENNNAPSEDKKSSEKKIFFLILLLFVVLAAAFFLMPQPEPVDVAEELSAQIEMNEDQAEGSETSALEALEAVDDCDDAVERLNEDGSVREACEQLTSDSEGADTAARAGDAALFDLSFAKTERVLGDRRAPIKITEHSSFTCGHCGMFHRNAFPAFKAAYIDTGKAYLVFSDFPLNAPALHASMIARCLPQDADYFGFVQQLFEQQDEWAYDAMKYIAYLRGKAAEFGLDERGVDACLKNEDLQKVLLDRIQAVQSKFDIRSTPSFVINNQKVLSGAMDFENFDKGIQEALADIQNGANAQPVVESSPEE